MTSLQPPPVALTIAGSDSGGGAGLQADLKTFATHGVFGTSVVTALTAQNTTEVRAILPVDPQFVAAQLDAVLDDFSVAAVKTGMLATVANVRMLAARASELPNLVVDPVLVSSSGHALFESDAVAAYRDELFRHASVVTPNLREAEALLGRKITTVDQAIAAATELAGTGAACVVIKGGHLDVGHGIAGEQLDAGRSAAGAQLEAGHSAAGGPSAMAVDVVWHAGEVRLLRAPRIATGNDHGTGCTFAAAVTARLARGEALPAALQAAKSYVHSGLSAAAGWRLGSGHGPLSWEVVR